MTNSAQHVFLSYVREDQAVVDRLYKALQERGVSVWLDRNEIKPGMRWKDAIRSAIAEGAFFLACFSKESVEKSRSFMNDELLLALEELRMRPADRTWFIPLKLNECSIPGRSIGGGESLTDIQWVDLSTDWNVGVENLASSLLPNRPKHVLLFDEAFNYILRHVQQNNHLPKSGEFTIGITGHTGVGKSSLINVLINRDRSERFSPSFDESHVVYDDFVSFRSWHNVGRFADVPALGYALNTKERAIEFITSSVDIVLYVVSASTRVHADDVDGVNTILDCKTPCIVGVNGMDRMDNAHENRVVDYIKARTGCPVITLSAVSGQNIDLLRTLMKRISKLYSHGEDGFI